MRRQLLGFALALVGLLAIGMAIGPAPTPAAAMPALQPSPRPTLVPTPVSGDYDYPDPPPMGRITGTVIDLRTGAPAPGKTVRVGESLVTSDSNGNYDIWVPKGEYPVALSIPEAEGIAAQNVTLATVWGNDTVVVHLFYIGPAAMAPTAAPTAAPAVAPTAELPVAVVDEPSSLPVTGIEELVDPRSAALGGLALLALGAALMLMPRHAPARVGVGASRALRRRKSAEDLLRELLRRDP